MQAVAGPQTERGDRGAVFHRIAEALRQMVLPVNASAGAIMAPVSLGELIDKITVLRIKTERISDPAKLENVARELALLEEVRWQHVSDTPELAGLTAELMAANTTIWEAEDAIRDREHEGDFGPRFVQLTRTAHNTNDKRAAIKRRINEQFGSALVEEKLYGTPRR